MAKSKREQLGATPEKIRPEKPLVELTEAQLEAIGFASARSAIAGGVNDDCPTWTCGGNHNETMFVFSQLNLQEGTDV